MKKEAKKNKVSYNLFVKKAYIPSNVHINISDGLPISRYRFEIGTRNRNIL